MSPYTDSHIAVRPDQLNRTAEGLRRHAARIHAAVDAMDGEMRRLATGGFLGQQAEALRARYRTLHPQLTLRASSLEKFAQQLDETAAAFRKADTAEMRRVRSESVVESHESNTVRLPSGWVRATLRTTGRPFVNVQRARLW